MTDAAGREDAPAEVPVVLAEPHRRYNALTDEWVLVSAERTRRPWQGRRDHHAPSPLPSYDPSCYLCPGNTRANGEANPTYEETFVFTNDFAALRPDSAPARFEEGDLLRAEGERGTCRVLCFSPRHDLTLGRMTPEAVRRIIDLWAEHSAELGRTYRWVQVFENRGQAMGASSPHPHGQIWAGTALPVQAVREDATQLRWCDRTGQRLLLAYAAQEHDGPRVVVENDDWLVVVPFWAAWPFETLVLPRRPVSRLPDLGGAERDTLAATLIDLLRRYDELFRVPFPYSMGWHQAPNGDGPGEHWQLHGHFYPPLLSSSMRKFMVGYELLAEVQRDLSPEDAAYRLRSL
ncbi:MAG TPA: UDP-glucose--hexose-1-phosphate uridylyltransferase [Candidatus Limnocylindrales bacterium]